LIPLIPLFDKNISHVNFLADAGAYMLLALGLNIVVGYAGLLDLGYAAFFAIGSYSYAMLASSHFGILLGAPTLRLRGDYLAIVTLGFGEIVPQTFLNLSDYTNGPNGISPLDQPSFFGYAFGFNPVPYFYVMLGLIAFALWISTNLRSSRMGRAWMAIREDELAARHMGINTTFTKLAAFALGASFSGLAGVAYASKLQLVGPDQFSFSVSILVLSMLVLGGMGNLLGVVVGSFTLSLLNNFILPQATNLAKDVLHVDIDFTLYRFMLYGSILVAIMLFRPEGLIANKQRAEELHGGTVVEPI
jgi:ABC-type branched-subunit amino acid transport system permease subunit